MNRHVAKSEIFETTPGGILGERYTCSCGATSTAAQMAGTRGGRAVAAMFGHRPCAGIVALHKSGEMEVIVEG